jgi:uncharacterized protein YdeI (YjbR/CyaY-like superfamily)
MRPPLPQPILRHLRALIHAAVPDLVEDIKWGMPHFILPKNKFGGKNLAGIAAFKAHCALTIHGVGRVGKDVEDGMGQFGKITAMPDLPSDAEITARLQAVLAQLASPVKMVRAKPASKPELPIPDDFARALAANPTANATLTDFAPSHRREYVEWISEAKQPATRDKRIAQAIEWLAEGKRRNWKYEAC